MASVPSRSARSCGERGTCQLSIARSTLTHVSFSATSTSPTRALLSGSAVLLGVVDFFLPLRPWAGRRSSLHTAHRMVAMDRIYGIIIISMYMCVYVMCMYGMCVPLQCSQPVLCWCTCSTGYPRWRSAPGPCVLNARP